MIYVWWFDADTAGPKDRDGGLLWLEGQQQVETQAQARCNNKKGNALEHLT